MHDVPRPFKVVRTDRELELRRVDRVLQEAGGRLVLLPDGTPEAVLAHEVADADLLLMCYARIGAPVLAQAARLKAIVKYGVGIDAIDALLMALFKRFKPLQQAMQRDGWAWPEPRWLAHDLSGKTLGLVGLGRIGRNMARMAAAFRMRVLAFDPHLERQAWPAGVERCAELDELLARSDAVSIHCVLDTQTRHLLGAAQLARMKPEALLVNVARGEIVDEAALLQALTEGRIAGAALDVYGREPLSRQGHPLSALYGMDNVLLWPHLSFYTHEAMQRLEDETLARCFEALRGEPLTVASRDPRLRAQTRGVRFVDEAG